MSIACWVTTVVSQSILVSLIGSNPEKLPMEVNVVQQEPVTVVAVQGSVDGLTAESLTQALASHVDAGRPQIVADFSGVQYVSSAGLRSLLITLKSCRAKGGDFRLAAVQPSVHNVLSIAGFTKLIKVYESVALAVDSFGI